jgi:hypothetical protein
MRNLAGDRPVGVVAPIADALQVSATLYRSNVEGGEPLLTGAEVQSGEQLFLELEAAVPLFAYVLNEDRDGNVFVLFPVPGFDLVNPLPGGIRHRLPGRFDGAPHDWRITSEGGNETVLIVCARRALAPLEQALSQIPPALPGGTATYAEIGQRTLEDLRGIGGTAPSLAGERVGARLSALAEGLSHGEGTAAETLWMRTIELRNPR